MLHKRNTAYSLYMKTFCACPIKPVLFPFWFPSLLLAWSRCSNKTLDVTFGWYSQWCVIKGNQKCLSLHHRWMQQLLMAWMKLPVHTGQHMPHYYSQSASFTPIFVCICTIMKFNAMLIFHPKPKTQNFVFKIQFTEMNEINMLTVMHLQ